MDNDMIYITWSVDDILCEAEELGISVTKDEARKVLGDLEAYHDSEVGINWTVIGTHLEEYRK